MRTSTLVSAIACIVTTTGARAHHSPALYDMQNTIVLVGTVARYQWGNPHAYVHISVEASDGADVVWEVEAGSPSMMELSGWSASTLRAGDLIRAEVSPARNPTRKAAILSSLQRADGTVLLRSGGTPLPAPAPAAIAAGSLSGNWLPASREFVRFVGPLDGWPLTESARAALAKHVDAQNGSQDCVSLSAPFLMAWSDLKQIEVREHEVIVRAALIDDVERVIHLPGGSLPAPAPAQQGRSVGRWEGSALVVDTTDFLEHASGVRAGVPSSRAKRVTERFELSPDRTRLMYSYVLEDPVYLAAPVTGRVEWVHRPDLAYTGYACDPEIARRFLEQ
jgi:hypothetical protein